MQPRLGAAIGDSILDLHPWLEGENLNGYMGLSAIERKDLRRSISKALEHGARKRKLVPQSEIEMLLPAAIGDYTDFYASIDHATNVGRMLRPDNPLLPNYRHVPLAYHGRSSSIVVSGTAIRRPCGQLGEGRFGPSQELDYEVELGAFIGPGNELGKPIPIAEAERHIAGVCLVNDWSARDIQRWEYQPLGPFLAKNFATSVSPWIVTLEALEPFRVAAIEPQVPVLPYLRPDYSAAFDITLEVWLRSSSMPEPVRISRGSFRQMYWTLAQMVTHHSSNGCPLRPGDLIASGTVSGPAKENRGCLLEITSNGSEPLQLRTGEERVFLNDGDEVILTGNCERDKYVRIGMGVCRGIVLPVNFSS
jgi:fumarylacetoacetase